MSAKRKSKQEATLQCDCQILNPVTGDIVQNTSQNRKSIAAQVQIALSKQNRNVPKGGKKPSMDVIGVF